MPKERTGKFSFKDRSGKIHGRGGHPTDSSPERSERKPSRKEGSIGVVTNRARDSREIKLKATVDKNHKGFGFLIFENRKYEDAFVPPNEAESFFHGDRVEVKIDARGAVASIDVLEHRFREVVGRFEPHPMGIARGGKVIYERKRAREEIFIPEPRPDLNPGDWIKAKLCFHETGPRPVTAEITEVYGPELPPSADIGMVAAEYNLIEAHSPAAESEASSFKLDPDFEIKNTGRADLRDVPFITIDGETARDFDDAVYVEKEKAGYLLWVAIADVSHYVTDGTALDQEARSRGTSVYFPERAFHMLPRALSENLCSLKPNEPRLTLVAKIRFDRNGDCIGTEAMEAVIQSKRRATYNEMQAEFEAKGKEPDWEFAPHFELYRLLRAARSGRGSIDFDLSEAELVVKPTGEVVSITERARVDAHRLIEEFMIAANEAVTRWMMERKWPFVYRIHDEPSQQALEKFQKLAATVGLVIKVAGGTNSPLVLAEAVRKLEGHDAQALLNDALLRAMKRAIYSSIHGIHYGLASTGYTHFTSPIRRYPDLIVHRLIRQAIRVENKMAEPLPEKDRELLETELAEICEHCSYRERIASDAERESIKLKQVRAMIPEVGNAFEGKIVGMMESGLFVKITNPYCEGMVSKDTMMDDAYEFNEDRMTFVGRRKKRGYKIGDAVKVRCVRAEIDRRQIDFSLES
jgi:ribonuclease R